MPAKSSPNALIVVADGHKAILFRDEGTDGNVSLREERRLTPRDLANEGPSGSRPTEQSPKQTDEATFAKQLAQALYEMLQKSEFDQMVLMADPQTLGQLRSAMHKSVEASVARSVPKNFTNHSVDDIAKAVGGE
jgi:protein required for attachment to host cells